MKRHPIDLFSLIGGVIVTAAALSALGRPWQYDIGGWAGPTVLILTGVAMLAIVIVRGRRDADGIPVAAADTDDHDTEDPDLATALVEATEELDRAVPAPGRSSDDSID